MNSKGITATATVEVEIRLPMFHLVDDMVVTPANTPVTIDVLANDSDPNGDTLTLVMLTSPSNGTAEINQDGTITYTPDTGYSGTDAFGYTVSDGNGGISTATVAVTIQTPEGPPIVDSDALVQKFIRSIEPLTIGGELDYSRAFTNSIETDYAGEDGKSGRFQYDLQVKNENIIQETGEILCALSNNDFWRVMNGQHLQHITVT